MTARRCGAPSGGSRERAHPGGPGVLRAGGDPRRHRRGARSTGCPHPLPGGHDRQPEPPAGRALRRHPRRGARRARLPGGRGRVRRGRGRGRARAGLAPARLRRHRGARHARRARRPGRVPSPALPPAHRGRDRQQRQDDHQGDAGRDPGARLRPGAGAAHDGHAEQPGRPPAHPAPPGGHGGSGDPRTRHERAGRDLAPGADRGAGRGRHHLRRAGAPRGPGLDPRRRRGEGGALPPPAAVGDRGGERGRSPGDRVGARLPGTQGAVRDGAGGRRDGRRSGHRRPRARGHRVPPRRGATGGHDPARGPRPPQRDQRARRRRPPRRALPPRAARRGGARRRRGGRAPRRADHDRGEPRRAGRAARRLLPCRRPRPAQGLARRGHGGGAPAPHGRRERGAPAVMLYLLLYPLHVSYPPLNVFKYITFRTLLAGLAALTLSLVLGPMLIRRLSALQIGQAIRSDGPANHASKAGTPTMGGTLIIFSLLLATLMLADLSVRYVWIALLVTLGHGLVGFLDDYAKVRRRSSAGIPGRVRLAVEFAIAGAAALAIYLRPEHGGELNMPFLKDVHPDLGLWYVLFGALVVVGAANAVNLTDGLDGLAIGPVMIAGGTYAVFAYTAGHAKIAEYLQIPFVPGDGELAVFCGALAAAGLGFLWFNAYPAQMFMGDVGSLALGSALGIVALITRQELVLVLVGGVFVVEALSVIGQVISFKLRRKRIFRMAPVHHHFELLGWPEPQIIVRFWIVSVVCALLALATLKLR